MRRRAAGTAGRGRPQNRRTASASRRPGRLVSLSCQARSSVVTSAGHFVWWPTVRLSLFSPSPASLFPPSPAPFVSAVVPPCVSGPFSVPGLQTGVGGGVRERGPQTWATRGLRPWPRTSSFVSASDPLPSLPLSTPLGIICCLWRVSEGEGEKTAFPSL